MHLLQPPVAAFLQVLPSTSIQDIKQRVLELPETRYLTAFHLAFNGKRFVWPDLLTSKKSQTCWFTFPSPTPTSPPTPISLSLCLSFCSRKTRRPR